MTTFDYEGKTYELKMTRAGIRAAEAQGLEASQIAEKPFSALGLLFFASLFGERVAPAKAEVMLDSLLDAGTVTFESLFEELSEAYVGLFGSGGSDKKK